MIKRPRQEIKSKLQNAKLLQTLGQELNTWFNGKGDKQVGFALIVYPMDTKPFIDISQNTTFYISNTNKDDILDSIKDFVLRAEIIEKDREIIS